MKLSRRTFSFSLEPKVFFVLFPGKKHIFPFNFFLPVKKIRNILNCKRRCSNLNFFFFLWKYAFLLSEPYRIEYFQKILVIRYKKGTKTWLWILRSPGTDVMILKILSTKNSAKKMPFLAQHTAKLCKNLLITLVFEKNANFFAQNCK
jgi:hypothetical protein